MREQNPQRQSRVSARHPRVEGLEPRQLFAAPGEVVLSINHPTTGHTYHLLEPTGWVDAEAKAVALGGHLVVVNDRAEQDFLWATFGPLTGIFWIGIHDTAHEGRFVWTTGEPPAYTNWFPGEPNNLYPAGERWGNMWVDYGGRWNDLGPDSDQRATHFAVAEVRNAPDLFATLADVPASLQPGGAFELAGSLTNLGSVTSDAPARVAYYLSADAALDAGDRLLSDDLSAGARLPFNASVPIADTLTIPADVQPGTYFVLAQADAGAAVAEADEANNVTATRAFDVGAVLEPVVRTVRGVVRDGDDLPLHGVEVRAGDAVAHTDYDGRKGALDRDGVTGDFELPGVLVGHNVTFGGTFGRFVAADGETRFAAAAADLTGAAHATEIGIGEILTLNGSKPDGGLARGAAVDLRPIFFVDYKTTAADGTIRLHRDLRSDKNSGRISTKPNKSLAASARYRKGVEAVTARLSALGFRENADAPLATVPALTKNAPAERALKLFKDVVSGASMEAGKSKATGVVDEATLAALNANPPSAGPLWADALPPKWSAAGVVDGYVNRTALERMRQVAEASPDVAGFVLTRASPATGGTGKTHRTGGEIEFRWIDAAGTSQTAGPFWEPIEGFTRKDVTLLGGKKVAVPDPGQLGVRWRYVAGYDPAKTSTVIHSLLNAGTRRVTFNDPAILQELGAVTISPGPRPGIALLRENLRPGAGYDTVLHALV